MGPYYLNDLSDIEDKKFAVFYLLKTVVLQNYGIVFRNFQFYGAETNVVGNVEKCIKYGMAC